MKRFMVMLMVALCGVLLVAPEADARRMGGGRSFGKQSDMKRAAQPEELSPAYVFLAAPSCAGYITGIVLPVTGSVGT